MASSKTSPGPHDRSTPKEKCIRLTALGKRCSHWAAVGKLCRTHFEQAEGERSAADIGNTESRHRGGTTTSLTKFVMNEQARRALQRLGLPDQGRFDPKVSLLDAVRSAWEQMKIWEQLLAGIDPADFEHLGKTPIPGSLNSDAIKGTRIDIISKHLMDATKAAARASKLAIDAGIEERLVRLAEEQSALIADTVRSATIAAIASLRLSPEAEKQAIEVALGAGATHLRTLATGGEVIEGVAQRVDMVKVVSKS